MWLGKYMLKYAGILVDSVHRVTGGLVDDEQGCFRTERGCVDQIFTLKQISKIGKLCSKW